MTDEQKRNGLEVPVGVASLYDACKQIYPEQGNPLQVAAMVKYWLGGPDPLDYISMYSNEGNAELGIPPHWHYVSFGLSDLHGDGRVHVKSGPGFPSGFGIELTMRLKKEPSENVPPAWPATILQALARYVFQSNNPMQPGDHVSWHQGLKYGSNVSEMLCAPDAQLPALETALGSVTFVQIVGVCPEELKAAQSWNGTGVLGLLAKFPDTGGRWLVTDMSRKSCVFQQHPECKLEMERGIEREGCDLSGVGCECLFTNRFLSSAEMKEEIFRDEVFYEKNCFPITQTYLNCVKDADLKNEARENLAKNLDRVHIVLSKEAGSLLPMITKGRFQLGRHFTFKNSSEQLAITFMPSTVSGGGCLVNPGNPFVCTGGWLQIYIPHAFVPEMQASFAVLSRPQLTYPQTFYWPLRNLAITVLG